MPTTIASSIASPPSSAEIGKCSFTIEFTSWFRSTSDGPRSSVATFLTYWKYCWYQGLSSPNFRLRFASTAGGTARSDFRNGLPLIARIIRNVMKMTRRMIGIVQRTRRTTNFNMRAVRSFVERC